MRSTPYYSCIGQITKRILLLYIDLFDPSQTMKSYYYFTGGFDALFIVLDSEGSTFGTGELSLKR